MCVCHCQDWHIKPAWGSYTFDERLFPYPADSMGYLAHKGLHVAVNLHDDDGVVRQLFESACDGM